MPTATLTEGSGRADRLFRRAVPEVPRTLLKLLFRTGRVRANGHHIRAGDHLEAPVEFEWFPPQRSSSDCSLEVLGEIGIIHDTGNWFVLNKPSGLHTARLKGRGGASLEDWLDANEPETSRLPEHGLVNRLDQDTSGIVVVARDLRTRGSLRSDMASADKTYWTVVCGNPRDHGKVDFELRSASRSSGMVGRYGRRAHRTGETRFRVLDRRAGFTLLEVELVGPGARHQIRAHLAGEGFPVAGDVLYGRPVPDSPPRLALHAWKLRMSGGREVVTAPVPGMLMDWWESLPPGKMP